MTTGNNSNITNNREMAEELNILIGGSPSDTMGKVASVLHFLSDMQMIEGCEISEDSEYGNDLILTMCRKALMFEVLRSTNDLI